MDKAERFRALTCMAEVRRDLRDRSVKAATFTGGAALVDFVIRLGSTAILARLILPEHFGLVMMVMAVTAIAEQLRELGLSAATVQQKEITHEQVTNLFWINVFAGGTIAALVSAISPLVARYYAEPRLIAITCLLASNFLFGGLMVQHQALLTRQLKLGQTALVRLLSTVVSTLLAIALAWMDCGYWALVWREVSRSILLTAGMWLCLPWIPGLPSRRTDVRSMVGFGTNLSVANIVGSVSASLDRFLIGRFWGAGPVAIYRQAYQLMVAPTDQLLSPLYQVAQPGLSMLQADGERFRRYYQKILKLVCIITMPISLFVAVYSAEITRVFLGQKWMDSAPILMILSLGTFIKQAVGSTAFILVCRGNSRMYLALTVANNALFIITVFIGVRWGILGMAMADVLTTWLMVGPRLHFSLRDSPVSLLVFFRTIARPATASITMSAALMSLSLVHAGLSTIPRLFLGGAVGTIIFCFTWVILPGGMEECRALFLDLRSAFGRKTPLKEVEAAAAP
jgi:O-antigen/teichoic acid export membrane protein